LHNEMQPIDRVPIHLIRTAGVMSMTTSVLRANDCKAEMQASRTQGPDQDANP
jgi:hypothetical protein